MAIDAPFSRTPILDREASLPARTRPGSGLGSLMAGWAGVLLLATAWLLTRPPAVSDGYRSAFRRWLMDQGTGLGIVGLAAAAIAAYYLMIAVHELGHAAAGFAAGFRLRSLRIGPIRFERPLRASLYRGPGAIVNGIAEVVPAESDRLAARGMIMVLGGPAANILSALFVLLLPFPIGAFSACFVAFSLANGVNDLFPFESRLGVSDGRRIGMLWRRRASGERWLALLRLGGDLGDGALPESVPEEFLAKALAVRDGSADTVAAHAIAFWVAYHRRQDAEAAERLETALTHSGHAQPTMREALMSEAAVFQARRRQRADLAGQWLASIPAETPNRWFQTRAEAAILEAQGDTDGALRKLADVEAAFLSLPDTPRRATMLHLLDRWKADLHRTQPPVMAPG